MPSVPDGAKMLAWIALLMLILRSFSVCTFVFLSVNVNLFLRTSIQVHAGSRAGPYTTRNNSLGPRRDNIRSDRVASPRNNDPLAVPSTKSPRAGRNQPRPQVVLHQEDRLPPPPYSVDPPKPKEQPSAKTIAGLYEDIIASDSRTIQVQQETLQSQQEVIRSQTQMIKNLRLLLEEQDVRIEEMEELVARLEAGVS